MGYERHDLRDWRARDDDNRRDPYRDDRGYRNTPQGYDDDRGFFERAGDEVRSWFGDDEAERRRRIDERNYGGRDRDQQRGRGYPGYDTGAPGGYGYGAGGSAGFSPYTGGTYRENSNYRYDPHYHEWRDREIANLDRDYDEFRREHQSRFENDFGSWRNKRQGQRQSLNTVREHQEVVGSDGSHVGTVDHVRSDRIILTKSDQDASGRHHSIPCSWIARVSDKVELDRTAADAQAVWKDEERRSAIGGRDDSDGPHVLNRSFSGTY
jgi:hypothetical protein